MCNTRTCEILLKNEYFMGFSLGLFLFGIFSQCGFLVFCHKTPDSWRNSSQVALRRRCGWQSVIDEWLKVIYSVLLTVNPPPRRTLLADVIGRGGGEQRALLLAFWQLISDASITATHICWQLQLKTKKPTAIATAATTATSATTTTTTSS